MKQQEIERLEAIQQERQRVIGLFSFRKKIVISTENNNTEKGRNL